jgi:hypothetical protein
MMAGSAIFFASEKEFCKLVYKYWILGEKM